MKSLVKIAVALVCAALVACGSAPAKKADATQQPAKESQVQKTEAVQPEPEQNLELAHAMFIQAMDMELRGLRQESDSMWLQAWAYDRNSRYLSFKVAQKMLDVGQDSLAMVIALHANGLKGKKTASQFETMAKLYVKEGAADSARKYFVLALDSSKYQDMKLLYDYSLFLEAVQDKEELVRVYDLLLPQTHFVQSLFDRQVNLLIELKRDSAVVDLFEKAYDMTGDKQKLATMVHALLLQKRYAEVRAVADTVTSSTESDAMIIELALLTFVDGPRTEVLKFLKKKYYEDGVRVPELVYHLGLNEYMQNEVDSARLHLEQVHLKLDRDKADGAQACRTLSAIAFKDGKNDDAVRYAEQADSILAGEGKVFLALALGTAGRFTQAYDLLDSMLGVWSKWTPMEAIADSVQLKKLKAQAMVKYRRFQRAYADVLILEARKIEETNTKDSLKLAAAREARLKAELFWESMLAADSLVLDIRFEMAKNLERLGRIEESYAMFEYIIKSPRFKLLNASEVYNYYGYTLLDLNLRPGDVEKGFALVEKALERFSDSNKPDAILDSKAWGLYRLGRYEEALQTLLQIKEEKFQDDDEYLAHLAAIHAALGNKAEATKAYKKLLKVSPGHPAALEYLKGKKK